MLRRHFGHAFAGVGASPTLVSALTHHLVSLEPTALLFARAADVAAQIARVGVMRRAAKHEIRICLTDLGAVGQRTDVVGVRMLTAQLETVLNGVQADRVAAKTLLDALLHVR